MIEGIITEDYAESVVAKWSDPTNPASVHNISDPDIQRTTAIVLENIENEAKRSAMTRAMLTESVPSSLAPTDVATGQWNPIALALARRSTPDLFAWKCVGVQPMRGPVGLAYAMRFKYAGYDKEADFDDMQDWSGYSGSTSGTSSTPADSGTGVSLATGESWQLQPGWSTTNPMPQLVYAMDSTAVTAKTRKLAANISLEALMDVQAMHGINIKTGMIQKIQNQIVAEKDRELLYAMKTQAVNTSNGGAAIKTWQTSASDGRWGAEKYSTAVNSIIALGNTIRNSTRLNPANFVVVSTDVASIIQAVPALYTAFNSDVGALSQNAMAQVGTLNNQLKVYVDTYATTNYALLGLKGNGQDEAGIIYSPYVDNLISEATDPTNMSPRIACMSRYAITNNLLGAGRYYRLMQFIGLSGITQ